MQNANSDNHNLQNCNLNETHGFNGFCQPSLKLFDSSLAHMHHFHYSMHTQADLRPTNYFDVLLPTPKISRTCVEIRLKILRKTFQRWPSPELSATSISVLVTHWDVLLAVWRNWWPFTNISTNAESQFWIMTPDLCCNSVERLVESCKRDKLYGHQNRAAQPAPGLASIFQIVISLCKPGCY